MGNKNYKTADGKNIIVGQEYYIYSKNSKAKNPIKHCICVNDTNDFIEFFLYAQKILFRVDKRALKFLVYKEEQAAISASLHE